jgi:hypothetical protein
MHTDPLQLTTLKYAVSVKFGKIKTTKFCVLTIQYGVSKLTSNSHSLIWRWNNGKIAVFIWFVWDS